jgi:hypothetical protein
MSGPNSEVAKMSEEIRDSDWFAPDDLTDEDRQEIGLDDEELDRLREIAEHLELADPLIYFLSVRRLTRGGGRR